MSKKQNKKTKKCQEIFQKNAHSTIGKGRPYRQPIRQVVYTVPKDHLDDCRLLSCLRNLSNGNLSDNYIEIRQRCQKKYSKIGQRMNDEDNTIHATLEIFSGAEWRWEWAWL